MYPKTILRETTPGQWEKCDQHFFHIAYGDDSLLRKAVALYLSFGGKDGYVVQIKHYIFIW